MSDQLNRVRFTSDTTGTGSTVHFSAAYSNAYLTPSEAGVVDTRKYTYIIQQGTDIEIQQDQVWTNSAATLGRGTPAFSKISGTAGTTKLTLDGTQTITLGPSAQDLMFQYLHGADIASASTLDLQSATGEHVDVTGTTTITAITLNDGQKRSVRFTGALTLTHGSSLVLPGSVSRTTAAGDTAEFRGYGSGVVRCVRYNPISGKSIVLPAAADITDSTSTGQALMTAATAKAARATLGETATGHGDSIYTILSTDRFVYTNAALTAARVWTLPAANALNAGQSIVVFDLQGTCTATNTISVARAGSDTLNGATTSAVLDVAFDCCEFTSDGTSNWAVRHKHPSGTAAGQLVRLDSTAKLPAIDGSQLTGITASGADVQAFSASGTWTKPSGKTMALIVCQAAGGGGASGESRAVSTAKQGGPGGGGGERKWRIAPISDLGATETVTIGSGGAGGASRNTTGVGFVGGTGGATSFGSWLSTTGGSPGSGTLAQSSAGGAGAGTGTASASPVAFEGGTAAAGADGASAIYGAGAGGGSSNTVNGFKGGSSLYSGAGGGAGGGETSGNALLNGGEGGVSGAFTAGGVSAGTSSAGSATAGTTSTALGYGGGGGGSGTTAAAGAGGAGGPGGGGGGGGSSRTGQNSGAGGAGGAGRCWVISW